MNSFSKPPIKISSEFAIDKLEAHYVVVSTIETGIGEVDEIQSSWEYINRWKEEIRKLNSRNNFKQQRVSSIRMMSSDNASQIEILIRKFESLNSAYGYIKDLEMKIIELIGKSKVLRVFPISQSNYRRSLKNGRFDEYLDFVGSKNHYK